MTFDPVGARILPLPWCLWAPCRAPAEAAARLVFAIAGRCLLACLLMAAQDARADDAPWAELAQQARQYVAQESPDSVWPFEHHAATSGEVPGKLVIAHYFPPFPISTDNKPAAVDHWNAHYLARAGENGKFARSGGFTRERPLPLGEQNTPYWRELGLAIEIARAQAIGVDAFGVDIVSVSPGRNWDQEFGICKAAEQFNNFHFIPEFDAGILKNSPPEEIVAALQRFATCKALYRMPGGAILVIPFAPEGRGAAYWKSVVQGARTAGMNLFFVPDFLSPGKNLPAFEPFSSGLAWWGQRSPGPGLYRSEEDVLRLIASRPGFFWAQPIAPQDIRPKQSIFFESHNSLLFRSLWMTALQKNAPAVHLITWNDYSEGTEFAPSSGTQFFFYDLTAYYIEQYKSGAPPRVVKDTLYYLYRNQLLDPDHPATAGDSPFENRGESPVENEIEVVTFLTKPARLQILQGGEPTEFFAPEGFSAHSVAAQAGRPSFRLLRAGASLIDLPGYWMISGNPDKIDPLYRGGSSNRKIVEIPKPADEH